MKLSRALASKEINVGAVTGRAISRRLRVEMWSKGGATAAAAARLHAGKAARHEKLAVVDVCPSSGEEEVPTNVEHDQP